MHEWHSPDISICTVLKKKKLVLTSVKTSFFFPFGGDKRDRTADLLNAIQALSQLSYTPRYLSSKFLLRRKLFTSNNQGNKIKLSVSVMCCRSNGGRQTHCLGSQLSYTPIFTCACRTGRPNELYFSRVGRVCQLFFFSFLWGLFQMGKFSEKGDTHGESFMI